MDEARSKYVIAHHHRWNWQSWNTLPGVVELVEELCLRFGLIDDNTQIRLRIRICLVKGFTLKVA